MAKTLNADVLEATRLTQAGRPAEATATLHRMLMGACGQAAPAARAALAQLGPPTIEGVAEQGVGAQAKEAPRREEAVPGLGRFLPGAKRGRRLAASETLRASLAQFDSGGLAMPAAGFGHLSPSAPRVPLPPGAQFLDATFSSEAGTRPYKLYVPSGYRSGRSVPLIVMLHGCTQSPDDFAAGTRMNEAAEEHVCLVVYPGQTTSANMQKCWNWFSEGHQHRGRGEPALVADLARAIMRDYAVDPQRVYVAGLSAGGAAAAVMGDAYPDLFAAIGVHSGLACGAARDMPSALAAMRDGGAPRPGAVRSRARSTPAIIFHGDTDRTVNPRNAEAIIAQSAQAAELNRRTEQGRAPGGHAYSRTLSMDEAGRTMVEQWVVHGAGHAWSGGSAAGSYTDPRGPDATREMLRFFLEHPHPAPA